jgi:hypothetical protein
MDGYQPDAGAWQEVKPRSRRGERVQNSRRGGKSRGSQRPRAAAPAPASQRGRAYFTSPRGRTIREDAKKASQSHFHSTFSRQDKEQQDLRRAIAASLKTGSNEQRDLKRALAESRKTAPKPEFACFPPTPPSEPVSSDSDWEVDPEEWPGRILKVPKDAVSKPKPVAAKTETEPETTKRDRKVAVGKEERSFSQVAKSWVPRCNAGSVLEKTLIGYGIHPIYHKTIQLETNQHPVSAAVREVLTARAFAELAERGWREICSLYSAPRDLRLMDAINKLTGDKHVLCMYRPQITTADSLRSTPWSEKHTVASYDTFCAYLLVDVYDVESEMFSAKFIRSLLHNKLDTATVVWIGHRFTGDAGTIHGESAWYRQGEKIYFRSDRSAMPYALHSACDWLWEGSKADFSDGAVGWTQREAIGDMVMVVFKWFAGPKANGLISAAEPMIRPHTDVLKIKAQVLRKGFVGWVGQKIRLSGILQIPGLTTIYLHTFTKPSDIYLPANSYRQLTAFNSVRSVTELTTKQFSVKIRDELFNSSNPVSTLFYGLFPHLIPDIDDITYSFLGEKIQAKEEAVWMFNASMGAKVQRYNSQMKQLGVAAGATELPIWVYGVGAACLIPLIWTTRRVPFRPMSAPLLLQGWNAWTLGWNSVVSRIPRWLLTPYLDFKQLHMKFNPKIDFDWYVFNVLVTGPIPEELGKHMPHFGALITTAIVTFEATMHYVAGGWIGLAAYSPAALMHVFCAHLPLIPAIATHFVWNLCALLFEYWGLKTLAEHGAIEFIRVAGSVASYLQRFLTRDLVIGFGFVMAALVFWFCGPRPHKAAAWAQFRDLYYFQPWEMRPPLAIEHVVVEPFDPSLSWVPSQNAHCSIPEQIDAIPVLGDLDAFKVLPLEKPATGMFWLVALGVPGYCPARSDYNLACVAEVRVLAKPAYPVEQQEANVKRFFGDDILAYVLDGGSAISTWWFDLLDTPQNVHQNAPVLGDFEAWLDHLESWKKVRACRAQAEVTQAGNTMVVKATSTTKVMVKTDELLFRFAEDGTPQLKPRAIANVNPRIAVTVGPEIWEAQKRLTSIWGPESEFVKIRTPITSTFMWIKISYAGAFTDLDLTLWYHHSVNGLAMMPEDCWAGFAVIASGDDNYILFRTRKTTEIYAIELDASMYDQTVREYLLLVEYMVLLRVGVARETIHLLWKTAHASYLLVSRDQVHRVSLDRSKYPQRDTGGVDTSIGNSIVMLMTTVCVASETVFYTETDRHNLQLWFRLFAKFGLSMKGRIHPAPFLGSFLKGMWFPCEIEDGFPMDHYWAPLPSRILKATKTLRQPRQLYPEARTTTEAAEMFMNDMAMNYCSFMEVPGLRVLRHFLTGDGLRRTDIFGQHKVQAEAGFKPRPRREIYNSLQYHYGISEEEWMDFESRFPRSVFQYISHPVLKTMVERDYA